MSPVVVLPGVFMDSGGIYKYLVRLMHKSGIY